MMDIGNTEAIGGVAGVLIAAALWIRKLKPSLAVDDKLAAAANADTGIIERLEREADRLSKQNDILAENLNKLQLELVKLSTENGKLHLEIIGLREENAEMRRENAELNRKIDTLMTELKKDSKP